MKVIDAAALDYKTLNEVLRQPEHDYVIEGCCGQRFIGAGMSDRNITVNGISGNALGTYLNNASITVNANAQDAVGDTMNAGKILIHGSAGDAAGYAMRGGKIYVRDHAGYRAGIHMKEYKKKVPIMIIGGCAGSFLGEYQAGGTIIVLGLEHTKPVGNFCGMGMHGGRIYLRCSAPPKGLPRQITVEKASEEDMETIETYVKEFCEIFGRRECMIMNSDFYVLRPDSQNPYRQLYTQN